jgi:hypothetical protein
MYFIKVLAIFAASVAVGGVIYIQHIPSDSGCYVRSFFFFFEQSLFDP